MQSKLFLVIFAALLVVVGIVGYLNLDLLSVSSPEIALQATPVASGVVEQRTDASQETVLQRSSDLPQPSSDGSRARPFAPQFPAAPVPPWYAVARVIDGDTVILNIDGASTTVRLIGLDTPEVVDPKKPVQCFGPEASAEAKKLLDGQTVRVETDPSQDKYDVYGRLLAYIFLPDGANFDELMIAQGYGREYTFKKPYFYQAEFKQAQAEAKAEGRGLWSACAVQ